MSVLDDMPDDLVAQFMSFLEEVDGEFVLIDKEGLVNFVAQYGETYPRLRELFTVDKDALVEHFKRTGEVPPGIKLIHTSTEEGSNVTRLEVHYGSKGSTKAEE